MNQTSSRWMASRRSRAAVVLATGALMLSTSAVAAHPITDTSPPVAAGQLAAKAPRSRDATYATVLAGKIPKPLVPYGVKDGRLNRGDYARYNHAWPNGRVWIKNLDEGTWKRGSVRFVDVAGDRRKEAVLIISRTLGGVGWPNAVVVYDGNGRVVSAWDSGAATGADAREGTSFGTTRSTSVDFRVVGIQRAGEGACCGSARATYRLSKAKDGKPRWTLINRR